MIKALIKSIPIFLCIACSIPDSHTIQIAQHDDLTIENAQVYYNTFYAEKYTRSNIDERLPFVIGDAEWLWDQSQTSSYDDKSAVDIPIIDGYNYKVYRKQADGSYYSVYASSKIVAVQEDTTSKISFYIRVSIPETKDENTINSSLNFGHKTGYNGIEYYITIDGCPVAVVKYKEGVAIDGVFLGDLSIDRFTRVKTLARILNGICISKCNNSTRNDTEMKYGQPGEVFMDQFGTLYVYVDVIGNDGISDAVAPILDEDIACTLYFGGSNNGGNSGANNGGSGCVAGSMTTNVGNFASGSFGGAGGGSVGSSSSQGGSSTGSNNSTIAFLDKTPELVNPILREIPIRTTLSEIIELPAEPLTTSEIKALILDRISPTNPVLDFIMETNIPIRMENSVHKADIMTIYIELGYYTIYYDTIIYNRLTNAGRLLVLFHEYMHGYLREKGLRWDDHNLMISSPEYQQGLCDLFPDMSAIFYEYIQYTGCQDIFGDTTVIHDDMFNYIYKYLYKW